MSIIQLIVYLLITYFSIVFIIPAIIVPNHTLYEIKVPITSKKLKKIIKKLNKIKDDEKFVKSTFMFITKRYKAGNPIIFIANLPKLSWYDPNKIIEKPGFAYCHLQNLMLRTILLESKRFSEKDITKKTTFTLVIHQYLLVRVKGNVLELDPWAYRQGIPYGKHSWLIPYIKNLLKNHQA